MASIFPMTIKPMSINNQKMTKLFIHDPEVEIDAGIYRLIYELGSQNATPFCRLTFIADSHPLPEIIEADSEITKRNDLLMNATAAV
jgi:hypothetical protein